MKKIEDIKNFLVNNFVVSARYTDILEKAKNHVKQSGNLYAIFTILLCAYLLIFFGLGYYPLIDVDETRYAVMARDMVSSGNWNDLLLNGEPFLEKPPLYFWMLGIFIKGFNNFNPFIARLPIALSALALVFMTYYVGKRIVSIKFGLISALMLMSSVFYLIFTHIAILDMVLTVCIGLTLYCGFLATISENKSKFILWNLFYIFMGLGFLAKGILAIAFPITIMFLYCFITGKLKEFLSIKNWLLGAVLFLVIILPWHIAMYKEYGYEFLREYFIKHHFERFVNSAEIGRKQPFWFFVPVFALAFMPWILTFLASLYEGVKDYIAKIKNSTESSLKKFIEPLKPQDNVQALLLFSTIYFVVIFGVLSISSTKLPSYILPVLPPAAILTAWIWNKANPEEKNWKYIAISTEIIAGLFILVAIGAIFAFWFLPFEIKIKLLHYRDIAIFGLLFVSLLMLLKLKYKKTMCVFATYILLMVFIMSIAKMHVFNTMYSFGQNELVKYAQFAKDNNAELVAFDFAVKPSMLTVYDKKINYIPNPEFDKLQTVLETSDKPVIVIFKIKNLKDYKDKINPLLKILIEGDKYSMYKFR